MDCQWLACLDTHSSDAKGGLCLVQPALLPLKKVPGKPDKNFKRPQSRANGAAQGPPERPKPLSGDPGIERCLTSAHHLQCLSRYWHQPGPSSKRTVRMPENQTPHGSTDMIGS